MISSKFLPTNTSLMTTSNTFGNYPDLFQSVVFIVKYVFGGRNTEFLFGY